MKKAITAEEIVEFEIKKIIYLMKRNKGVHKEPLAALKRSFERKYGKNINPQIAHWLCAAVFYTLTQGSYEKRILEHDSDNGTYHLNDVDGLDIGELVETIADNNRALMEPLIVDMNSGEAYLN